MKIEPMNLNHAQEYTRWKYASPYEFYNIPPSGIEETMDEILGDNGMDYYSVLDEDDVLFGMYAYSFQGKIMEIGLGIRPERCCQGSGKCFLRQCISFGREKYAYTDEIRLMVADFNNRAIHLYRSVGFVETGRIDKVSFRKPVTFLVMELGKDALF